MGYLKSFIIGSSWFVFVLFFISVMKISNKIKNYSYESYTIIAPLYLGLMNAFSLYLARTFNLTLRQRYILIGLISPIIVIIFARITNSYNFSPNQWYSYYLRITIKHFLIFNIIVYYLELLS